MNTLTSKQAVLLSSIMLFASKLLILPSILFSANGTGGIINLGLILLFELGFLLLLIKVKNKNPDTKFYQLFKNKLGKFPTILIYIILFIFFTLKTLYILQESFSFLKHSLYPEANILVYIICVIPVITALAYKGLKSFGRTVEIFYVVIVGLIIFCTFIWALAIENFTFSIFFNNGLSGFINGTFSYTFWFGDFIFLMFILDKVKFDKSATKNFLKYIILSIIILVSFMIVYFFTFQTTSFLHTFAILDIIQFVSDFGTIGKFDIIAILAIMFILYFQLTTFLYCANDCLCKIFPLKHRAQGYIILNIIILVSCYAIIDNSNLTEIFYSPAVNIISIFVMYVIPLLYFSFAFQKPKNKFEKRVTLNTENKELLK